MSFIASVIGTSAYSSSLLKKLSMRSKMMMSASWLAITSFAACLGPISDMLRAREIRDDSYRKEDTGTRENDIRGREHLEI
jgi:hypothetical protein